MSKNKKLLIEIEFGVVILFVAIFIAFKSCNKKDNSEQKIISDDFSTEIYTRADYIKPEDKYKFSDISGMNDWARPTIIQERKAALQIPDAVLANISTAGLLETCLDYPYLLDMFVFNDYQKGFNALMAQFNGFRELLKRPDLVNVLLNKYYYLTIDVKNIQSLQSAEQGRFTYKTFALEFILAQDVVLEHLNAEQERELFLLSFEHKKIKSSYSDIFGNWNDIFAVYLYAKKTMHDNAAGSYANKLSGFIKAPTKYYIDTNISKFLEEYVNTKYRQL